MSTIEFAHPERVIFMVLAVIVILVFGTIWMRQRTRIVRFYGSKGGRILGGFRISCFIALLAVIGIGLGLLLCQPHVKREIPREIFEPLHIVIAVDISKSMLVPASRHVSGPTPAQVTYSRCRPSRLTVAAHEVEVFIRTLEDRNVDKVALVIFARYAYPAIPVLTDDYRLFKRRLQKEMLLENVLTMTEGTDHWQAVEQALPVFGPEEPFKKILIILTDGEPDAPGEALMKSRKEAIEALGQHREIEVYVLGVGEPGVRHPVPLGWRADGCPDEEMGYMVQAEGLDRGQVMATVTEIRQLRALAEALGGVYVHSVTGSDLAEKMRGIVESVRERIGVKYKTAYIDLSEHLMLSLLLLLAVAVILKTP